MTATFPNQRANPLPIIILAILAALILGGLALPLHADDKHGASAQRVRDAAMASTLPVLHNASTGRDAHVCKTSNDLFGVWITEGDPCQEVTAFEKERMKTLDQIIKYLQNRGYGQ